MFCVIWYEVLWPTCDFQIHFAEVAKSTTGHHLCPNHLLYSGGYSIKIQLPVYINSTLLLWVNNSVRSVRMNTEVLTPAYTLSMALRQATGWQKEQPGDSCAPQHQHWLGTTGQNVLSWNIISWICFWPQKVPNVLFLHVKIETSWAACSWDHKEVISSPLN